MAEARSKLPIVLPRNAMSVGAGKSFGSGRLSDMSATTGRTSRRGYSARRRVAVSSRIEHQSSLFRAAGSKLDERRRTQVVEQWFHLALEQRALGARQIVLGEPRDLLEQLRADAIVEVFRRQLLLREREAAPNVAEDCRLDVANRPPPRFSVLGDACIDHVRHPARSGIH
jgi:hypothetical protein